MSSRLIVNSIRHTGASGDAVSLANDGTCTANITNRTNKNLVINGACLIAQRGTSSTADGYGTVDRFQNNHSNTDEAPTQAQADVASGTTPYTSGFRKSFKITNGNQTSGAGSSDEVFIRTKLEAQDLANSGWNYTSASSFITFSFWVKSSVAQNFYGYLRTKDGTSQSYPFETGALSADTWTKVTKTIAGNSNLTFNNDNGHGLEIYILPFSGTDYTGSVSLNDWGAYSSSTRTPDNTSTWYTTNDATFEITGVQLEVGSVATDFEHRSFAQELALCQRYCQVHVNPPLCGVVPDNGSRVYVAQTILPVKMRTTPTLSASNTGSSGGQRVNDGGTAAVFSSILGSAYPTDISMRFDANLGTDLGDFRPALFYNSSGYETTFTLNAEL